MKNQDVLNIINNIEEDLYKISSQICELQEYHSKKNKYESENLTQVLLKLKEVGHWLDDSKLDFMSFKNIKNKYQLPLSTLNK